jgi:hypothetical protein
MCWEGGEGVGERQESRVPLRLLPCKSKRKVLVAIPGRCGWGAESPPLTHRTWGVSMFLSFPVMETHHYHTRQAPGWTGPSGRLQQSLATRGWAEFTVVVCLFVQPTC